MSKHREQSLRNRSDILRKCYPLVATGSWDAIAISDIEKVIKQTRGAIAYYFKNKKTLFANILDELFFPVFALSDDEREKLSKATVSDFYNKYKTPFERVYLDLKTNYNLDDPSRGLFNILIQAQNHYKGFCQIIGNEIKREIAEISEIIKGNNAIHIDLGKVYAQSAGVIFLESLY